MPIAFAAGEPKLENGLAFADGLFRADDWQDVTAAAEQVSETERSYLPHHKKGGTIAYETLDRICPSLTAIYRSRELRGLVSRITGVEVQCTPEHDQSSCSILVYERPGDHIGWHYDHNFYKGRHFTVLVPIVNRGTSADKLSSARLLTRWGDSINTIETPANRMVVFEGAKVRHKVTPIAEGERRVIWSMTYCADPRNAAWQGVARRFKDTAFFGIRALWT